MSTDIQFTLYIEELCARTALSREDVREIVYHEIISPRNHNEDEWQFSADAASIAARAARLHRDLELDWHGVALAIRLLQQVENLERENRYLRQRLLRFEQS